MPAGQPTLDRKNVFLNVPFDRSYEKLLVALIASIVAARMVPRCAVELPERGQGQFERVIDLLAACQLSIHELSRPERFNMPFELGLAACLRVREKARPQHEFVLLDSRPHRLARRLSDVSIKPLVHGNGPLKLIAALTDNLGGVGPSEVEMVYRALIGVLPKLRKELRLPGDEYLNKRLFEELVSGAIEVAECAGVFK